jgi:hypothetical protein
MSEESYSMARREEKLRLTTVALDRNGDDGGSEGEGDNSDTPHYSFVCPYLIIGPEPNKKLFFGHCSHSTCYFNVDLSFLKMQEFYMPSHFSCFLPTHLCMPRNTASSAFVTSTH